MVEDKFGFRILLNQTGVAKNTFGCGFVPASTEKAVALIWMEISHKVKLIGYLLMHAFLLFKK